MKRRKARQSAGFSLIELMVVIFIIGLMATVVVLNVPSTGGGVDDDAKAFAARLRAVSQDSILSGDLIGVSVREGGAGFYRYRGGVWEPLTEDDNPVEQEWVEETSVSFALSGRLVPVARETGARDKAQVRPQIIFEPTGINTAFAVVFERDGTEVSVTGDEAGSITVTLPD